MTRGRKKGQGTLEYVLLVTAVIVVIIGMVVNPASPFRKQLNTTLNTVVGKMGDNITDLGGK